MSDQGTEKLRVCDVHKPTSGQEQLEESYQCLQPQSECDFVSLWSWMQVPTG